MRPVDGDPSKINQPSSQSMNAQGMEEQKGAAYHPNPLLATRSSDRKRRLKQGAARCGSSSFDRSVCLEGLTVELEELFHKKGTTARIISLVCCAKNKMPRPGALEMKLKIEPMRPGKRDAVFYQYRADPFPAPLPSAFAFREFLSLR